MPPAKPCRMRKTTREVKLPLKAQPIDVSVKTNDGDHEQPAQRQHARQPSCQRNCDDLGDQISGLNPAHRVRRNLQRLLDGRQRCRDDLDVEDRHEHAEAHQDEAEPGR